MDDPSGPNASQVETLRRHSISAISGVPSEVQSGQTCVVNVSGTSHQGDNVQPPNGGDGASSQEGLNSENVEGQGQGQEGEQNVHLQDQLASRTQTNLVEDGSAPANPEGNQGTDETDASARSTSNIWITKCQQYVQQNQAIIILGLSYVVGVPWALVLNFIGDLMLRCWNDLFTFQDYAQSLITSSYPIYHTQWSRLVTQFKSSWIKFKGFFVYVLPLISKTRPVNADLLSFLRAEAYGKVRDQSLRVQLAQIAKRKCQEEGWPMVEVAPAVNAAFIPSPDEMEGHALTVTQENASVIGLSNHLNSTTLPLSVGREVHSVADLSYIPITRTRLVYVLTVPVAVYILVLIYNLARTPVEPASIYTTLINHAQWLSSRLLHKDTYSNLYQSTTQYFNAASNMFARY